MSQKSFSALPSLPILPGVKYFFLSLFVFANIGVSAQRYLDSLHEALATAKNDSVKIVALDALGVYYQYTLEDSCYFYARELEQFSEKVGYPFGKIMASRNRMFATNLRGNYPGALSIAINSLPMAEQLTKDRIKALSLLHSDIALVSREMSDFAKDKVEGKESYRLFLELPQKDQEDGYMANSMLGRAATLLREHSLDTALEMATKSVELASRTNTFKPYIGLYIAVVGNIYEAKNDFENAKAKYLEAMAYCKYYNNVYILSRVNNNLSRLYGKMNQVDSAIYYARIALQLSQPRHFGDYASTAGSLLAQAFELKKQPDSALKYVRIMLSTKDTLFSGERMKRFETLMSTEEQRKKEIGLAQEKYRQQLRTYALLAILFIFLLIAFMLLRNNRQKQKANALLQSQKKEIEKQRAKAEMALEELQSAQAQLIQSEKMASLGELTAGIAHEIQNPLNFVNNFSEVNQELIAELREEQQKSPRNPHAEISLLRDIEANEEKINHHGKRADAIVKSMLQHSSIAPGLREMTDLNGLADEYLRISYHGCRAKDKKFNAAIETNFDEAIGKINMVPQDMGKALINLFNNAFYAVNEKKSVMGEGWSPLVRVSTNLHEDFVEIRIRDNGTGIPQKALDKIYQPFFTTKPTGQGTGLGLSLAYEIIAKEHGGTIKVETNEGEFTCFIIQVPIK